ncbi:MAG: succinyl-diaminopimelate desuccinylase [Propionibacteriaceae bacterium]|nr:succinyl-diaminopimelate desuccinylase [Propionibacteriaceae bacterium]
MGLDLEGDLVALLRAITDIESVSGNEARLASEVEAALGAYPHLEVSRHGNAVVARTNLGRDTRVIVAGHLDTVPVAANLPSSLRTVEGEERVYGRGTCDMKGGVAVQLRAAATLTAPVRDVTWVFYDNEEVDSALNGLGRLAREAPGLLAGDFAVLGEPTGAMIEGGCQGTVRFHVITRGKAAHSARSWLGDNAIHRVAEVLDRIGGFEAREIEVDGLTYREGLNAVEIAGGIAGNVIPDACLVHINYRFAPDKSLDEAIGSMRELFAGFEVELADAAAAARPGLHHPVAADFVAAAGGQARAKYGWTDVARFAELGIPAVNFGPADPGKAHTDDEFCPVADLYRCYEVIRRWLGGEDNL